MHEASRVYPRLSTSEDCISEKSLWFSDGQENLMSRLVTHCIELQGLFVLYITRLLFKEPTYILETLQHLICTQCCLQYKLVFDIFCSVLLFPFGFHVL